MSDLLYGTIHRRDWPRTWEQHLEAERIRKEMHKLATKHVRLAKRLGWKPPTGNGDLDR